MGSALLFGRFGRERRASALRKKTANKTGFSSELLFAGGNLFSDLPRNLDIANRNRFGWCIYLQKKMFL
jgi:hypothetical protein